jgi:hypothetical protein
MKLYLFIVFLLANFSFSCKQVSKESKESDFTLLHVPVADVTVNVIDLYPQDSIYQSYLPDTSLIFNNPQNLKNYVFQKSKVFDDFCNERIKNSIGKKDFIILANRSAQIRYSDLLETLYFKFIKKNSEGNGNMGLLSNFSPYSNIISIDQRKEVFQTFPAAIRYNSVGKNTWKRLEDYSFVKNNGFNVDEFKELPVKDTNGRTLKFGDFLDDRSSYTILVFGASWCAPCRLEEMQLKHWIPFIDTSVVKIIGLSVDSSPQKWEKALGEDDLPWKSYLLENNMHNPMIKKLDFDGIPMNFLLDSNKTIITQNTDIRKVLKQIPIIATK